MQDDTPQTPPPTQPTTQPTPPAPQAPVQPAAPVQSQPTEPAPTFEATQKIVIVEDNVALADIYKTRLSLLGYSCFAAYDGREALETIKRVMPDLVLLDLMVPKIAGDQILETMRTSDWGRDIKVQIISNLNEADAPAGLREWGIEGYAVKANLSNDQLDQLVDSILKPAGQNEDVMLEAQAPVMQSAPPTPLAAPAPVVPPSQPPQST